MRRLNKKGHDCVSRFRLFSNSDSTLCCVLTSVFPGGQRPDCENSLASGPAIVGRRGVAKLATSCISILLRQPYTKTFPSLLLPVNNQPPFFFPSLSFYSNTPGETLCDMALCFTLYLQGFLRVRKSKEKAGIAIAVC